MGRSPAGVMLKSQIKLVIKQIINLAFNRNESPHLQPFHWKSTICVWKRIKRLRNLFKLLTVAIHHSREFNSQQKNHAKIERFHSFGKVQISIPNGKRSVRKLKVTKYGKSKSQEQCIFLPQKLCKRKRIVQGSIYPSC